MIFLAPSLESPQGVLLEGLGTGKEHNWVTESFLQFGSYAEICFREPDLTLSILFALIYYCTIVYHDLASYLVNPHAKVERPIYASDIVLG